MKEGMIFFNADSEALISKGLAAILIAVYSEEPPEVVVHCPAIYLKELGVHDALSPGRSNGLGSLLLRIKSEAQAFLYTEVS